MSAFRGSIRARLVLIPLAALSLLHPGKAHGQLPGGETIGIDFGSIAPDASTHFNYYSDVTIANGATESFPGSLINTDGDPVAGVGFSVTNKTGQATGRATSSPGTEGFGLMTHPTIYQDWLIANDSGSTGRILGGDSVIDGNNDRAHLVLTFSGLNDSLTYELTGGWDHDNANFNAIWKAGGKEFTTDVSGVGYGTLSGLLTDGNGKLVIHVIRPGVELGQHVTAAGLTLKAESAVNPDGGLNFPATVPEGGYQFPDAFPGLTFVDMAFLETLPGDSQKLFVGEKRGKLWLIPDVNAATPTRTLFLDLESVQIPSGSLTFNGMTGFAFHPDFANNGYIYVAYVRRNEWSRVSRFTADPVNFGAVNLATEVVLFQQGYHRSHGINRLVFGPDGYLYIPIGDGKQDEDGANRDLVVQTIDEAMWSSILRIDVDKKAGNHEPNLPNNGSSIAEPSFELVIPLDGNGKANYSIPADNPFLDQTAANGLGVSSAFGRSAEPQHVRTEMFAIGFRNPWKIGFVPGTSSLWVADVAFRRNEKFCIVPAGGNAGWRFFSGTMASTEQATSTVPFPPGIQYIQPVVEYGTVISNGDKSIVGGDFYLSSAIPALTGAFIMCDYTRGDIWAIKRPDHSAFQLVERVGTAGNYTLDTTGMATGVVVQDITMNTYEVSSVERIGGVAGITSMIPNPTTGEMLMADYDNKIIRKIEFVPGDIDSQLPPTLTATGAFADTENFATNPEMHPYDVNLSFWSDNAIKSRFFNMVDAAGPMTYSQDGFWDFPAGAVWMKHFDLDLDLDNPGTNIRRLETRFIVKTAKSFYAMSYQWNEAGTEATLVGDDGANFDLNITENSATRTQTWSIPSRSDCIQCHHTNNHVVLGFNTRQLNHVGQLDGQPGNFLSLMETEGYLSSIGVDPSNLPKHCVPGDTSANLENRVRSYLEVNCAYCHFEGNGAVPPSWSGESLLSLEQTHLLHGEAVGFNVVDPTDRLVIPGDTANSIILSRASAANGYSRMPPVGSNIIDPEGVALLTDWINNHANAAPTISAPNTALTVAENTPAPNAVGNPDASDPDAAHSADRGTLTYSIISGNDDGLFEIDANTGEIRMAATAPDFEELGSVAHPLTIQVSDGFPANPKTASAVVPVTLTDVANDDSQGDGIADEWAFAKLGSSNINAFGDTDKDGTVELLEYWADTDPNLPGQGFTLDSEGLSETEPQTYHFSWIMRKDLVEGVNYIVQGTDNLNNGFTKLVKDTDYTVKSTEDVAGNANVHRVTISLTTSSTGYFIRIATP